VSIARSASSASNERRLLYTLAAVQFTHVLDFMIMMPLGAGLMRVFAIGPAQFGNLVASYGLAAAISGFLGGFVLDRFERKRALLALYAAFTLSTLGCALAPTYEWLLLARIAAGAFGGVASGVVTAMVGDAIPAERRGQAMATVMAAFPLSSVLGVPLGLLLAGWFEWHAPFFLLAGLGLAVFFVARQVLPVVPRTLSHVHPVRQMGLIVSHPVHVRAFVLSALLVFAGGCVIPFMAPSLVANAGWPEKHLPYVYFCGGACVFFTMPWFGRLSDRHDKLHVLAAVSAVAVATVLVLTRLGPGPVAVTLAITSLFFVSMSGRFSPAMAMVANAVDGRYRGGFMSVNGAIQQAATGCATLLAGRLVAAGPGGALVGYPRLGYLAAGLFVLTVLAAAWLRAAAPHAARNPAPALPLTEA
jgi:multidrug resistance protein